MHRISCSACGHIVAARDIVVSRAQHVRVVDNLACVFNTFNFQLRRLMDLSSMLRVFGDTL